jgi:hypothetical protein
VNFSQFGFSASANGYTKLPNGIILQWGSGVSAGYGALTVTWPIAFPTGCFVAFPTIEFAAPNALVVSSGALNQVQGVFYTSNSSSGAAVGTVAFGWWAIGN